MSDASPHEVHRTAASAIAALGGGKPAQMRLFTTTRGRISSRLPTANASDVSTALYRYRSFIWQHAVADLRHRYAGTGMGVVWNVLHPLSLIVVYAVVFGTIMKTTIEAVPGKWGFPIYLCAGFFPWMAFAECMTRGATAFSGNAAYLKKLPVPEQVFVAQGVMASSLTLLIGFAVFIAIALPLGLRPRVYWLLVPIPIILLQIVGFGIGMIVATLNVFFTDVAQLLGVLLQILFWLTPIVYVVGQVPRSLRPILALNPATPAVEAVHDLLLWGRFPSPWMFAMLGAWAIVTTVCGYLLLGRLRGEIRDVL
jgi:lipopolysaccharide transport system permease protein